MPFMATLLVLLSAAPPAVPVELPGEPDGAACLATGLCPVPRPASVPSGVMFVATGLVVVGAAALRAERRGGSKGAWRS
jgi:hypothetical protein